MRKATGKIQKLGVEELVDNLLLANAEYAEIQAAVKKATGQEISDSALSRYRKRWDDRRFREDTIEQEVDAMMKLLQSNPDVDPTDGAMLLLKRKMVSRLAQADANFDQADALDLAHVLIRMKRTDQMGGQLKVQEERLELLKQKVAATAKDVGDTAKAAGLSSDVVDAIKQKILGVVPA